MKNLCFFKNLNYVIKKVWKYSKSFFLLRSLASIISGITPAIVTYLFKILVENIFSGSWKYTIILVLSLAFLKFITSFFVKLISKKTDLTYDLFRNELKFDLNKKAVEMDCNILAHPDTIDKKELATTAINHNFATKYLDCFFSVVTAIIAIISISYVMSIISGIMLLVILIIMLFKFITIITQKKAVFKTHVNMAPINKKITYYMQIMVDPNYANEMRMYSIAQWFIKKYHETIYKIHDLYEELNIFNFKTNIFLQCLSILEHSTFYIFLAWQVISNKLSYANFAMFSSALETLSTQITSVIKNVIEIIDNSLYVSAYREFMEIKNIIAINNIGTDANNIQNQKNIYTLRDVTFKYPGCDNAVFNKLNLDIEANKLYVIVGENGAGKTTFCKLLCRLYDVDEGIIQYNGKDIKEIEYSSYRNQIAMVFQDYKYYEMTIAENIAMDSYKETLEVKERINACINMAGLKPKIDSFKTGIDTQLGRMFDNDGVLLSGGELQKLALAKALYKQTPIIILDEPTSALDAFAEDDLMKTVISACKGKTVFYISHRLSAAKYADKVLFFDDNKVSGFDNHINLLKNNKQYAEMYNSQAKHYLN